MCVNIKDTFIMFNWAVCWGTYEGGGGGGGAVTCWNDCSVVKHQTKYVLPQYTLRVVRLQVFCSQTETCINLNIGDNKRSIISISII